jgi:hypothetical protein
MLEHAPISKGTRRSRFVRAAEPPLLQLTDRDIEIIRQVAAHRFLRSTHISQLLQAPHKKILERLTLLYHAGYLDRPRAQLDYHVRGGGSAPFVYGLGDRGANVLKQNRGSVRVVWTRKHAKAGRQFIFHTLAIADFRVALEVACRGHDGLQLQQPADLLRSAPEQVGMGSSNPWALRVRVQHDGMTQEVGLLPDYVFAPILPDGRRRPFMVECDRGTMPIERSTLGQTSMLRKFLAYEGARLQGLHTARFGWMNFRVLIVTSNADRIAAMQRAIQHAPALKVTPLFLFAEHTALTQTNVLNHLWADTRGKQHTLI